MATPLEQRNELLKAKDELIAVMRQIIGPINIITCRIDAEATKLIPPSLDEAMEDKQSPARQRRLKPDPIEEEVNLPTPPSQKPKRMCSICRKPGHRATTCPKRK